MICDSSRKSRMCAMYCRMAWREVEKNRRERSPTQLRRRRHRDVRCRPCQHSVFYADSKSCAAKHQSSSTSFSQQQLAPRARFLPQYEVASVRRVSTASVRPPPKHRFAPQAYAMVSTRMWYSPWYLTRAALGPSCPSSRMCWRNRWGSRR